MESVFVQGGFRGWIGAGMMPTRFAVTSHILMSIVIQMKWAVSPASDTWIEVTVRTTAYMSLKYPRLMDLIMSSLV